MVGRSPTSKPLRECALVPGSCPGRAVPFVHQTPRSSNLCRRMCLATPEGWRTLRKVDASSGDFAGPGNAKGAKAAFRGPFSLDAAANVVA